MATDSANHFTEMTLFNQLLEEYDIKDGNNVSNLFTLEDETIVSKN